MLDNLKGLVNKQINESGQEEKIQQLTLEMIETDEFRTLPEELQEAIYQLNMNDLNELNNEQYRELKEILDR
jgi:hypothetical protein